MRSNRRFERASRRRGRALQVSIALLAWASGAHAQVHWDLGVQSGATERIATGPAPGRTPGPSGEIHAHIALYPLLRVGPYAVYDLSPVEGLRVRGVYAGGLRAKVTPPWLSAPWRAWGFVGFGVAYAYTPGSSSLQAAHTTMPEIPLGVGIGHKIRGGWELCAELGARWNLAGLGGSAAPPPRPVQVFVGDDLLAVSLSVGVNLNE